MELIIKKIENHIKEVNSLVNELKETNNHESNDCLTMQKASIAKRYDISTSQVDKYMRLRVFMEEKHYCRPNGGYPLFYVEACDEVMLPKLVKEGA